MRLCVVVSFYVWDDGGPRPPPHLVAASTPLKGPACNGHLLPPLFCSAVVRPLLLLLLAIIARLHLQLLLLLLLLLAIHRQVRLQLL